MEDTEGIWPWKMNQEATDFAREEELWQGQEVSGVMWVLLNFSYFGAPTPSPKELYTELVDGLRGSNPCTSSGSENEYCIESGFVLASHFYMSRKMSIVPTYPRVFAEENQTPE
ncbi:hypothetical protein SAY86_006508 [Trapa natans]|uniref:Uncharacterized protein n=1 Tax=Trapa natans TaxID=22666 RepID=A0AAN7L5T6_TRANT|nr:hypothetical protein SAY86_006508 [Trapa natans]